MLTSAIFRASRIYALGCALSLSTLTAPVAAVSSAELYTTSAYRYGRFEARLRFAFGDGIVSSFFLWKQGSEAEGTFWNELDFEKLRAGCELETNALYGNPEMSHNALLESGEDLCGAFHVYAYEWTPDYIAWFVDDVEIRRESAETAAAFRDNAAQGMRIHFNVWPGDASFGGNFDPAILPAHQYIDWVEYSAYADGAFEVQWREDFDADSLPATWAVANWPSPKNLSTHVAANVRFAGGYAVLALTADDATGSVGDLPVEMDPPGDDDTAPAEDAGIGAAGQGGTDSNPPTDPPSDVGASGAGGSINPPGAGGTSDTPTDEPPPGAGGAAGAPATNPTINPPEAPPTSSMSSPAASSQATPSTPMSTSSAAPSVSADPDPPPASTATMESPAALGKEPSDDPGCDCRLAPTEEKPRLASLALAAAALVWIRRSRRATGQRLGFEFTHRTGSKNAS